MSGLLSRFSRAARKYWKDVVAVGPEQERVLFDFRTPRSLTLWEVFSDSEMGGKSTASLAFVSECAPGADPSAPPSAAAGTAASGAEEVGVARLSGNFSTEIGRDAPLSLRRSGFCGMASKVEASTHELDLDLDDFDTLVFRMRGDGRPYIASLREDSWVIAQGRHDIWQAFLFAKKDEWQDVAVPFDRFVLTHKGRMVENKHYMSKHRIISLSISLAGGSLHQPEGPYQLEIESIKAVNLNDDRTDTLDEDNPGPGSWNRRP